MIWRSLVIAYVLIAAAGCNTQKSQSGTDTVHYPYQGPLLETNGIPIPPPRW